MKIYACYCSKLFSAEARETPAGFKFLARTGLEFGCRNVIRKDEIGKRVGTFGGFVGLTARDAIRAARHAKELEIDNAEEAKHAAYTAVAVLKQLEEDTP